ncbi:hypothetical protein [Niabella hibiscisoli]|uniref:hypothetical protein n=1 Tax=Niabella hibiscisoli TaxID=1825928 RepID=UPI001F0E2FD0|nr:hypothetical protein [Niabella hibiscisoli]MCH5717802.1 hypothetical protein [Niabella hibiscisoli]
MNKIVGALLLCLLACTSSAQGIFNQKATQIKRYMEQIGLLRTYLRQAERGYQIVDKGLHTIRDIKRGEFNLHDLYYKSFKSVNPEVRRLSEVDAAVQTGTAILRQASKMVRVNNSSELLEASEKRYVVSVLGKIIDDAEKDLQYLDDLITTGRMALTDDERIKRINQVSIVLQQTSVVLQRFTAELQVLLRSRARQHNDSEQMNRLYNLKK